MLGLGLIDYIRDERVSRVFGREEKQGTLFYLK